MSAPGAELMTRAELATKCRSCGTCRSVCPVFAEVGLEGSVARGKVALIRSVLEGDLELTEIFEDRILLCLNCKACVAGCPNGVRVDDLILAARGALVASGRLPIVRRLVFRFLLRRGRLLPPFGRLASFAQRWLLRGMPPNSPVRLLLPLAGVDENRVFPAFAPRSFMSGAPAEAKAVPERPDGGRADRANTPASMEAPARARAKAAAVAAALAEAPAVELTDVAGRRQLARNAKRVAYFVGCATNLIYPETGRATVDTLTRSGVDVVVPRGQTCCGTPVFNSGDFRTARSMARRNIKVLRKTGADAVVTGCGSCGLTLKREYEEMLGFDGGVGIPVFDFAEFLAYRGAGPGKREAEGEAVDSVADRASSTSATSPAQGRRTVRVTFHDPCHLSRGQGIREQPRDVLRSLPWVEFVEMRDADRCCGSGGTFSLSHYDISKKIGARKVEAIREADVDIVVTECPSCVMQLEDMLAQAGLDVAVMSVADVLAQRGRV